MLTYGLRMRLELDNKAVFAVYGRYVAHDQGRLSKDSFYQPIFMLLPVTNLVTHVLWYCHMLIIKLWTFSWKNLENKLFLEDIWP